MTKSTLIKVLNENNVIFMGICQDNFYWVFGNFAKVLARFRLKNITIYTHF